jgi:hypothetical protein
MYLSISSRRFDARCHNDPFVISIRGVYTV